MNRVKVHQGDIIMIDAEPHAGREMGGHNPAKGNIRRRYLIVNQAAYNRRAGLVIGHLSPSSEFDNLLTK